MAQVAFGVYLRSFGTTHRTYVSVGAITVVQLWLIPSGFVLLLGAKQITEPMCSAKVEPDRIAPRSDRPLWVVCCRSGGRRLRAVRSAKLVSWPGEAGQLFWQNLVRSLAIRTCKPPANCPASPWKLTTFASEISDTGENLTGRNGQQETFADCMSSELSLVALFAGARQVHAALCGTTYPSPCPVWSLH